MPNQRMVSGNAAHELEPPLSEAQLQQARALRQSTHENIQKVEVSVKPEEPSTTRKVLGYLKWPLIIAAAYFGGKWLLSLFDQIQIARSDFAFDGVQNIADAGRVLDQPDSMIGPGLAAGGNGVAGASVDLEPAQLPPDVSPGSLIPRPRRTPLPPNP